MQYIQADCDKNTEVGKTQQFFENVNKSITDHKISC